MKVFALFILFSAVALSHAAERRPQEFYDPDVQQLLKTTYFAFGPVGFPGKISNGEAAFGRIVRKKEAIRYILAAFEHGSAPAKCYALIALRESSPEFFRAALASVRKNPPKNIVTMGGCFISEVEPEKLFAAIEAGSYAADFKRHEEKG